MTFSFDFTLTARGLSWLIPIIATFLIYGGTVGWREPVGFLGVEKHLWSIVAIVLSLVVWLVFVTTLLLTK